MKKLTRGILIAIEGIDGSGKSTLAKNLFTVLEKEFPVLLTKEPGASQLGKMIRAIVQQQDIPVCSKAEYLLFAADRAQHFEQIVIPALKNKMLVLSDRMSDSSIVYQGYGRGLDIDFIKMVNEWAMNGFLPNITIFVQTPFEVALKRLQTRKQLTAFEKETTDFMKKLEQGFNELFANKEDVIILDGNQTPEQLTRQAIQKIEQWLANNNIL